MPSYPLTDEFCLSMLWKCRGNWGIACRDTTALGTELAICPTFLHSYQIKYIELVCQPLGVSIDTEHSGTAEKKTPENSVQCTWHHIPKKVGPYQSDPTFDVKFSCWM